MNLIVFALIDEIMKVEKCREISSFFFLDCIPCIAIVGI